MEIVGKRVDPGVRVQVELPVGRLPSGDHLSIPIEILNGSRPGPAIWLSGAIHGDEIVRIEIIRQVLGALQPEEMSGTVVAAPVVNVFGFVFESRYLPDRRDLNRSFPGSRRGSLAARLARLFMDEVVSRCEVGIDFHAGSGPRRGDRFQLTRPPTRRALRAPSLRWAAGAPEPASSACTPRTPLHLPTACQPAPPGG